MILEVTIAMNEENPLDSYNDASDIKPNAV